MYILYVKYNVRYTQNKQYDFFAYNYAVIENARVWAMYWVNYTHALKY